MYEIVYLLNISVLTIFRSDAAVYPSIIRRGKCRRGFFAVMKDAFVLLFFAYACSQIHLYVLVYDSVLFLLQIHHLKFC